MGTSGLRFWQKGTRTNTKRKRLTHYDYTIGWISPLEVDLIAALEMLDEKHGKLPQFPADPNVYHFGSIAGHNIIVVGLQRPGNSEAAIVTARMRITFPNIRLNLLVGIGGGVPVRTEQGMIRLGHIVVSKPVGQYSGTVQYERGKSEVGGFLRYGFLPPPPPVLLLAAQSLAAHRARKRQDPLIENIQRIDTNDPRLHRYRYPGADKDVLSPTMYHHGQESISCVESVYDCDMRQRIPKNSVSDIPDILVHRGTIASGEFPVINGEERDQIGKQYGALCFEREAAGASNSFPCLVIRGISDYCDSHQDNRWHGFASAAAAAYARELFFHIPIYQMQK